MRYCRNVHYRRIQQQLSAKEPQIGSAIAFCQHSQITFYLSDSAFHFRAIGDT